MCFLTILCSTMAASRGGRPFSTDSNKIDEPFKVEEAETVNVPPPPTEKVYEMKARGFSLFCLYL